MFDIIILIASAMLCAVSCCYSTATLAKDVRNLKESGSCTIGYSSIAIDFVQILFNAIIALCCINQAIVGLC